MKFCWTTITVKDMEESLRFYQEVVGLTLNQRFGAGPGVEIAFLGNGETKVELICNAEIREINMGQNISLGFEVESVEEIMALVKEKGIELHTGLLQPHPHIKFFFVLDPNGLKIQFVENI